MKRVLAAATLFAVFGAAHAQSFSYSGAPVAIPDATDLSGTNPGASVGAPITVIGLSQPVASVTMSIDGTLCTNAAGATTVGLNHTFVNDLVLTLRAPNGTAVVVVNQADGSGNNLCQVVFDDTASASLQSAPSSAAPFTGTYAPFAALSAFAGVPGNGTWTLEAQDFFSGDTGSIRAWTINITQAAPPVAPAATGIPTLSEWGLIFLSSALAMLGIARVRRGKRS